MYRAFELNPSSLCYEDSAYIWYLEGLAKSIETKTAVESSLRLLINKPTIDGVTLREKVFPAFKKDVFISHSHNDEKLMYVVVGMLSEEFGLTVFADEFFWGSADKLLREIDDTYCKKTDEHTYNYKDRNLTTSHVHVMLSTAIMEAINQCEVFLFLNTDNSILDNPAPDIAERFKTGKYTLSPWIYQELLIASRIKPVLPERLQRDKTAVHTLTESVSIAYRLPQDIHSTMLPITVDDLRRWSNDYKSSSSSNALDCLYARTKECFRRQVMSKFVPVL